MRDQTLSTVQRTFLSAALEEMPDDLYCRLDYGAAIRERDRVLLEPHSAISTNTFFGRFPASYWQRWTPITELTIDATVSGVGRLLVKASDGAGVSRTVAARSVASRPETTLRFRVRIDRFLDGGALWVDAESGGKPLTVRDVRWSAPGGRDRPTAIAICTYNRADECLHTLEQLALDESAMDAISAVYVVDQGTDTLESRPWFDDVRRSLGDKLHYLRQVNLGGSGGFTRGLYEAVETATDEVNVLLMDDDIVLEPDTIIRVSAFGNRTTDPALVGGQMLCDVHPTRLLANAENYSTETLRVGIPITRSLAGANMLRKKQEVRVDAPYNAWWTCLIPSEVVRQIGYPLPLFFQWDDVEYGIRAGANGIPTVTLPGAAVWHSDLTWKAWDDWARYFHYRNGLVVAALHSAFDTTAITRNLFAELACCLISMQYGLAATMIKAIEDFLDGPPVLADGGTEAAVAVRKFRAEYTETQVQPAPDVPQLGSTRTPLVFDTGQPSMPVAVWIKRALWQAMNRTRPSAAIRAQDVHWWHLAMFRSAVATDHSQQGVRVYRTDRDLMRTLSRRALRALWRLRREGPAVRDRYEAAMPRLTSRDNWRQLFDEP